VRTLLIEKKLPHFLWAEALYHVCSTFNNIPKINEQKSPHEKFYNEKSNVDLIEFGSPVIFKTNSQNAPKLQPKGEHGVFVGFDQNSKRYRIYANHKIQIRRSVKFINQFEPLTETHPINSGDLVEEPKVEEPKQLRRSERIQQQKTAHSLSSSQAHFEPRTSKQLTVQIVNIGLMQ
jgi:hypothetical protein